MKIPIYQIDAFAEKVFTGNPAAVVPLQNWLSDEFDFVSRFFAPREGIDEDPVTGSAHTMLIPYWAGELGKDKLVAKQISKRSGVLYCKHADDRVEIGGSGQTYLTGEILVV